MRIDPLGLPDRPHVVSSRSRQAQEGQKQAGDRVELTGQPSSPRDTAAGARAHRMEALRDAIAAGRYLLTDDAVAHAILRTARHPHDRPV